MTTVFILLQESCCFRNGLRLFLKIFFDYSFSTGRENALTAKIRSRTASTDRSPIPQFFIPDELTRAFADVTTIEFSGQSNSHRYTAFVEGTSGEFHRTDKPSERNYHGESKRIHDTQ
jgi:hypothetical protein